MVRTLRVTIEGESYITLDDVAECYECEHGWVREVYDHGLLGRGVRYEGTIVVRTSMLDRVAEIRRLHVFQGVHISAIAALLRADD